MISPSMASYALRYFSIASSYVAVSTEYSFASATVSVASTTLSSSESALSLEAFSLDELPSAVLAPNAPSATIPSTPHKLASNFCVFAAISNGLPSSVSANLTSFAFQFFPVIRSPLASEKYTFKSFSNESVVIYTDERVTILASSSTTIVSSTSGSGALCPLTTP